MNGHTKERLKELQALPLERKVGFTSARIAEWYNHFNGKVYVSFSGGKDSTVLLHLVRGLFPDVKAMYVNTGLEYPEIVQFVKTFDNVDIIRPKISFKQVIEKYGYPVIGKEVSQHLSTAKTSPNGKVAKFFLDNKENPKFGTPYDFSKYSYLLDAPFKISASCCKVMKKSPASSYEKETGLSPITAQMAEESRLRRQIWLKQGCNAFSVNRPISNPMSFWTEQDVLEYIARKKIKIAPVYGDVLGCPGGRYTTGCHRTGCVFCLFGIKQDGTPNRIQRLAKTHPALWKYCIYTLGMKEVMEFLKVPYKPEDKLLEL